MEWFALYVKSRHEFFTYLELRRKGVETFLPTVKTVERQKSSSISPPSFQATFLFTHAGTAILIRESGFLDAVYEVQHKASRLQM
jgi:hypothetical protein